MVSPTRICIDDGLGILGMEERAELLDGKLDMNPAKVKERQ